MRIAILTFHRAYNCGAMLQAWALKTVLERMGHTVEFPVCNHVGESKRWLYPFVKTYGIGLTSFKRRVEGFLSNIMSIPCEDMLRYRYTKFRKRFIPERYCAVDQLSCHYDLLIVGSDQVWNQGIACSDAKVFLGENLPVEIKKIAYAVSYGDKLLEGEGLNRVVNALPRFDAVSVREGFAQVQLSELTTKSIAETLDPTLLLSGTDYMALADGAVPKEPYLFVYVLYPDHFFVDTARELARRLHVKCVIAPCYQYTRFRAPKDVLYGITPGRLVALAQNAKYLLSGSFHGTVMGILFDKPFISLRVQEEHMGSRISALFNILGCPERLATSATTIDEMEGLMYTRLAPNVYARLSQRRAESLSWLSAVI